MGFEFSAFRVICENCGHPIQPGGHWTGTGYSGWEHVSSRTIACLINGELSSMKADPMKQFTVAGKRCRDDDYDQPVQIRCTTCGQSLAPGDVAYLSELIEWVSNHKCPTWGVS